MWTVHFDIFYCPINNNPDVTILFQWTMPDNQKYGSSDSINFDVTYKIRH